MYIPVFIKRHCIKRGKLKLQYLKTEIDILGLLITLQVYLGITESFDSNESTEWPLS